jgi:PAS domain S-box-containing protein
MTWVLEHSLDLAAFAALNALAILFVSWRCVRVGQRPNLGTLVTALFLVTVSVLYAHRAGEQTRKQLVETVIGVAPTYAIELDRIGHARVNLETPAEDPTYLALIEAQKQWLHANPSVADIYTYRRTPEGKIALCVDSETDYDRDGVYDHDREGRTPNGEIYDEPDALPAIEAAFAGEGNFDASIYTDRWGTWVSANYPVRDASGSVYAVVGVDFPAEQWVNAILASRGSVLLTGLVPTGILLTAWYMLAKLRVEVSRRREAEIASRESESRLRIIVENEPETVMVVDRNGVLLEINPAGVLALGGQAQSLVGCCVEEFVDPGFIDPFRKHQTRVAAGESVAIEFQMKTRSIERPTIWMEMHSVPLRDARGAVTKLLSVARDVTARKHAEQEKEELQQQLLVASRQAGMAEVATGVLHNVGNVLNSVNVSAALINERLKTSRVPTLCRVVELIESNQQKLGEFVTQDERGRQLPEFLRALHDVMKEDHGQLLKDMEKVIHGVEHVKEIVSAQQHSAKGSNFYQQVNPTDLVNEAVRVNQAAFDRHGIQISVRAGKTQAGLLDRHKILQILFNLLANAKDAVKSSPAQKRIDIIVGSTDDGQVHFEVRDSGTGISVDNLKQIFRHGFTTKSNGHGFGLHSAAVAAQEMKGSLAAASDGEGKGACFTLIVPFHAENARRAA